MTQNGHFAQYLVADSYFRAHILRKLGLKTRVQAIALVSIREQLDGYSIKAAADYVDDKLGTDWAVRRLHEQRFDFQQV